ncbi:MAG: hypothetical protein J4469_04670, partial [Candidatus Aenigmarchaeota archaeon]|nr:hypothetical protein [Candidatus Aenigmarchaeota archaeon]
HGSGPVQIDVQLFGTPYLLSGFSGTFIFNVKNKGKGNIVNSQIEARKLVIEFPRELFAGNSKLVVDGKEFQIQGRYDDVPIFGVGTAFAVRGNLVTGNPTGDIIDGTTEWYLCKSTGEAGIYYYCNEPKNPVQPCLGSDMYLLFLRKALVSKVDLNRQKLLTHSQLICRCFRNQRPQRGRGSNAL